MDAALEAGCRSFDAALGGLGGCQFAQGPESNVSTLPLARQLLARGLEPDLPVDALEALVTALSTVYLPGGSVAFILSTRLPIFN